MGHHQKTNCFQTHLFCHAEMLLGNVGFRALGGNTDNLDAAPDRILQFLARANAGKKQRGDFRFGDRLACLFDQIHFVCF